MKYFVVTNEHGSAWNESRSLIEQEGWAEHAAFMNKLVDEGFIVLSGPLGDGSRALLVINTDSESTIRTRCRSLDADGTTPNRQNRALGDSTRKH